LQAIRRKVGAGNRHRGTVAARLRQFVMLNPRCAEMERLSPREPPKFLSRLVARRTKAE
jgi:hypothetical protein